MRGFFIAAGAAQFRIIPEDEIWAAGQDAFARLLDEGWEFVCVDHEAEYAALT